MMQKLYAATLILLLSFISKENFAQNWNQIIKTVSGIRAIKTSTARSANDLFGYSVAIDGDYAVVGAYAETSDENGANPISTAGSVIIFKRVAGVWTQLKKIVASDRTSGDFFGYSVSINANIIVVGAYYEDEDASGGNNLSQAGSAYIFYKDQGGVDNWGQVKKIVASDRASGDEFGFSVSINANIIVVGAFWEDEDATGGSTLTNSGSVYVFYKDFNGVNNWGQIRKIVSDDRAADDAFGISVDISGDLMVVGAWADDEDAAGGSYLNHSGSAYIFGKNVGGADNWGQVRKIVADDRSAGDYFATFVAIDGNAVVISCYQEDFDASGMNGLGNAGAAYVYYKDQDGVDNWGQVRKIVTNDRASQDFFSISVSIDANTIFVGASEEDDDVMGNDPVSRAGSAYLFDKDEGGADNWGQKQKVVLEDAGVNQYYGFSVAIDGDYAVVGAYGDFSDANGQNHVRGAGSAYILKNINGVWTEIKKLVASDRAIDDDFGRSVSIHGNVAVVGANQEDEDAAGANSLSNAGSAYIFYKDEDGVDNWGQVKKIVASDRASLDEFGFSVSISDSIIAVGAYAEDEDATGSNTFNSAGSVYIFYKNHGGADNWGQVKKIVASDRGTGDFFSYSLSISGNIIVVGAYQEDEDAAGGNTFFSSGSAYIFYKDEDGANNWGEVKKIVAGDRNASDNFGFTVSIDGDIIVAGAYAEDEDASGGNMLFNSGSAYIFYKNQGGADNWGEFKKIVASDREASDLFGRSVAINTNTIVVGARSEAHDETGANPLPAAGSSYLFSKNEGGADNWGQVKKIVASDRGSFDNMGCAVGISNNTAIVGAWQEDEDEDGNKTVPSSGSAYFYKNCITTNLATSYTSAISTQVDGIVDYYDNECNLIASVESGGGLYNLTGQVSAKVWVDAVQPSTPGNQYVKRHHEITPAVNPSTSTANIFLYYTQQEFDDFNAVSTVKIPTGPGDLSGISNILIEKRSGVSSDGSGMPSSYPGPDSTINPYDIDIIWHSAKMRWEVAFEITGFSGFFLKTISWPLPVSWLQINATLNNRKQAVVNWQVLEQDAAKYIVEKSSNGIDYVAIGELNSSGNGTNNYSFTEAISLTGTAFYRIKQVQKAGHMVYSAVSKLSTDEKSTITVFPNPATNTITITTGADLLNTKAILCDLSGKTVEFIKVTGASFTADISSLAKGIYILKFENGKAQKVIKL